MNLRELLGSALPWMPTSNQRERLDAVRLPRDERPHRSKMEWWHFMGYVDPRPSAAETDPNTDAPTKEELRKKRQEKRTTFVMSILRGQVQQVSHLASIMILMDHERKTYTTSVKLGAMQSSYFELQDGRAFRFHFGPTGPSRPGSPEAWSATGGMGMYTLTVDTGKQLALELSQRTPAVFLDERGTFNYDQNDGDPREMAYYLWPLLDVKGNLGVGVDEKPVIGQAWMEHQWGDVPIGNYRWRYLAVIIEKNDTDEYAGRWLFFTTEPRDCGRKRTKKVAKDQKKEGKTNDNDKNDERGGKDEKGTRDDEVWYAFWIKPDGSVVRVKAEEVSEEPSEFDVYTLIGQLKIEEVHEEQNATPMNMDTGTFPKVPFSFRIVPIHLHQECRPNLPGGLLPSFWEGACDVYLRKNGEDEEKKIGWAIMELAGFR